MALSKRTFVIITFSLLCIARISIAAPATLATHAVVEPRQQRTSLESTVREPTSCNSASDCPDDGVCINAEGRCQEDDCNGVCNVADICTIDIPCPEGQTCLRTTSENSPVTYTSCFPNDEVDDLSDIAKPVEELEAEENQESNGDGDSDGDESEDNPCIAIEMLQGFSAHELVFERHVLARVLCDSAGSCATKGHVVYYEGRGMMMGSYCDIVGCEGRVMKVNSPRYRRGLKVGSLSNDMHFTAFAARYGTIAEEAILATAVRIGL